MPEDNTKRDNLSEPSSGFRFEIAAIDQKEDIQSTLERILLEDPGEAGYELAGVFYDLLDYRDQEESRKELSWLKLSLFSSIEEITGWDNVQKGTFLISFALRWKKGHETLKTEFQTMLDKLEQLEGEIHQMARNQPKKPIFSKD